MVFGSICEHASSAFIFASTSSDQFSPASSEQKRCFAPSNLADMLRTYRGSTIPSGLQPIYYALFNMPFAAKLLYLASQESVGGR